MAANKTAVWTGASPPVAVMMAGAPALPILVEGILCLRTTIPVQSSGLYGPAPV